MSPMVKAPFVIASVFFWIGFVAAISFMEAWLKFRAPGVNIQIGLGIGRLVFNALNKAEWLFAVTIIVGLLLSKQNLFTIHNVLYLIPLAVLIAQTVWLLPALDLRAESRINGIENPSFQSAYILCGF